MSRPRKLKRFSQVRDDLGCHMSREELLAALAAPDAHVTNTAFSGLELSGVSANGTVFENVIFRGCTFDGVSLANCTFTDVLFSGCRFIRCDMGKSWLNRCDFRSCSAPGLTFLKGRLTGVTMADCQIAYCDFSEATVEHLAAVETNLMEANVYSTRLRHVALDRCDLTRATVFRASLSGMDLSTCEIAGIRVSSDLHELRGAVISPDQAAELMGLLGIKIKEEEWL